MIPREVEPPELGQDAIEKLSRLVFAGSVADRADLLLFFGSRQVNWRQCASFFLEGRCQQIITTGYAGRETPAEMIPLAEFVQNN